VAYVPFRRNGFVITVALCAAVIGLAGCAPAVDETAERATSAEDALNRQVSCLTQEGWDVVATDGGIQADVQNDELEAYGEASARCSAGLFTDPSEYSEKQWDELYALVVAATTCVTAEGYDVPAMPTRAEFVQLDGAWSPHVALMDSTEMSITEFQALEVDCPQVDYWG
jgi:hypothetical protein